MKKFYFLMIAILCVVSTYAQYGGGDGVTTPYQIVTEAHLATLCTDDANLDKKFILMNDLDMSNETFYSLGYYANAPDVFFTGEFDGNNKIISNVTVTPRNGQTYQIGFFGLAKDATIKDLGLINLNYTSTINRAGGLIGSTENAVSVTNCFIDGGTISAAGGIGGITGWVKNGTLTITDCYTNLAVNINAVGTDKYKGSGGIIGTVENATAIVTNVAVYGSKVDGDTQGAVIGYVDGGATVTASAAYYKQGSGAVDVNATEITDLSLEGSYTGFDFTDTWKIEATRNYAVLKSFIGLPLDVEAAKLANIKVYSVGKTIYINKENETASSFIVYNLSGVVVDQGEFSGSSYNKMLPISSGLYIVKTGNTAVKVKIE